MSSKPDKMDATIVNSITLGNIWGITDRRVRQLREESVISEVARGKFDLYDATRKYCDYLRQAANANANSKETKLSLDTEKALHEKAKREKAELQLQVMRGEVHMGEDVERVMTDMLSRVRTKLLALPSKVAPMVIGYDNIAKIQAILNKHVCEALQELSDYDPQLFINESVVQGDVEDA
jgi:phage terminase Nu1 subunit (DNA packaging protein)